MPPLTLFKYLKPCSRKKCSAFMERIPTFAMLDIHLLVGIQFRETLRQDAERKQRDTIDVGDLIFVRLAHVDDFDAEFWIVQRPLHFLHGDFVGIGHGRCRFRHNAAELLVIDPAFP